MPENPVLKAIRQRRSIRRFTTEPVAHEAVAAILEAGRWAPSGLNKQPWRFLALAAGDPRQAVLASCTKYSRIVQTAGTLVCVFLDRELMYSDMKDHQSAGAVLQNMLLAAHAQGLGAVWLGEIVNQAAQVNEALGLPSRYELQAVIALGHPEQSGSAERKPLAELLLEAW